MTEAQAVEVILQHWADGWEALHPADDSDPDHVPWVPEDEKLEAAETWVRISVIPTTRENGAIGGGRLINEGFISVQIFTPPLSGSQRGNQLADDVRTVLENASIASPEPDDEPVCVYAGPSTPGAPANDGAWKMKLVNLRYRYDEI